MQEFHFDPERAASGVHFLQKYFQTETWWGGGGRGQSTLLAAVTLQRDLNVQSRSQQAVSKHVLGVLTSAPSHGLASGGILGLSGVFFINIIICLQLN